MNIRNLLNEKAKEYPGKPAIIFNETEIDFSALRNNVFELVSRLTNLGVTKGDKAAIFLPNCPEYIYNYLALFTIGAVVVPLDFMLTEHEIVNFVNHSDTKILISRERKGIDFEEIKKKCSSLQEIMVIDQGTFEIGSDESVDLTSLEEVRDSDYSSIFYTSGSTGHPKGVLLTYAHFDTPVRCIDHFLDVSDQDSYLCAGVPFSHIGGLDYILFMLAFGSTLVLMDRFHPLESLRNIEKYKTTIFCIVPAMFVAILSLKDCGKFDLSSLRYAVVFGAPSSPELLQRFHQLCPNASLRNGWGMTETAAPNTLSPEDSAKVSSIGTFGAGTEVKIIDEEGNTVNAGERGELLVKGSGIMVGYYKEENLTRQVLTDDGWLRTGDIAQKDSEGLYYLVGRKKDMIKVGGEIVFASEVETVIHRHPKVQDVAVIGVPHELRGEVPRAFLVVKEGENLIEEEIRSFCKEHLAHFKQPHIFEFKSSLPKNRVGKIDKEALRQVVSVK